jgi:hemolysin activation/secretion protein
MKRLTLVLAVMLALGLCAISSVQAAPPPGADIGAQGTRVRDEAEEDKALMERQFPKAAPVKVEEEKAPPVEAGGLTFLLKEVTIKGATLFTPKELEPYYKDYIGKTVSLRDLQAIADSIKAKYSEMGYLTTIVYVPDQNIAEGKIEIKVVEGKMGKLNI